MSDLRTPRLSDVITAAIDSALSDFHVATPGRVTSFDASKNSIDVQPILKQTYLDEEGEEHVVAFPVIRNVPVMQLGGGGFRITFPVAPGDDVLLVFSDLSLDKYLSSGGPLVDPVGLHEHHLTDAIAIPGLRPFNAPWSGTSSSDMTVGKDGGPQLVFKNATIHWGSSAAAQAVLLGTAYRSAEDSMLSALSSGMTAIASAMTAIAAAIDTTAHITSAGPAAGTASTTAAAAAAAVSAAVASFQGAAATYLSTKVKVE